MHYIKADKKNRYTFSCFLSKLPIGQACTLGEEGNRGSPPPLQVSLSTFLRNSRQQIVGTVTHFSTFLTLLIFSYLPTSLVAEFGEAGRVVPAWMPRSRCLQQHLAHYAFPAQVDSGAPRLLLLPDSDHLQVVLLGVMVVLLVLLVVPLKLHAAF